MTWLCKEIYNAFIFACLTVTSEIDSSSICSHTTKFRIRSPNVIDNRASHIIRSRVGADFSFILRISWAHSDIWNAYTIFAKSSKRAICWFTLDILASTLDTDLTWRAFDVCAFILANSFTITVLSNTTLISSLTEPRFRDAATMETYISPLAFCSFADVKAGSIVLAYFWVETISVGFAHLLNRNTLPFLAFVPTSTSYKCAFIDASLFRRTSLIYCAFATWVINACSFNANLVFRTKHDLA